MKKRLIYIFIVCLFFLLFACKKDETQSGTEKAAVNASQKAQIDQEEIETIFAVNSTKAIRGEILNYLELSGDIKAKVEVDVFPDAKGKIKNFVVKVGDTVKKGQVVVYIDPSKPGMVFQSSPVKSPISGTITSLPVKQGATISQQTSIAKVGIVDKLEITTYISEKYISKIKKGLDATVQTEAFPDQKFRGRVTEISPVVDPLTRMMEIKLEFIEKTPVLKPGLYANIKIITDRKDSIVKIPAECVVKRYGKFQVFVIERAENDRGTVRTVDVELGIQIGNKVEITNGLSGGEEVVIRGQSLLDDKANVRVIETVQPLTEKDYID